MVKPIGPLTLYEEVLLLALHDKKGTIACGTYHGIAMGAGILSELLLAQRVVVDVEGKKSFLRLVDGRVTGDEILDEAIGKIEDARRRASVQTWVTRFAAIRKLKQRVTQQLCRKKILRETEKQILLFFTQRIYPTRTFGPERQIVARLRDAIFRSGRDLDERTLILLTLARHANLLPVLFDKQRLKSRQAHIEKLTDGQAMDGATRGAVEAAQAAIMVATVIPICTSTN